MKALIARGYGPILEVGELPVPQPGPGQIQARIHAASLNAADVRLPRGDFRDHVRLDFPHVPGNDFAGTVTAVGEGVTAYGTGAEIFGHAIPRALRHMAGSKNPSMTIGTLAEYAVFEANTPFLAHRPTSLNIGMAAALPTAGLTANALMATAGSVGGERLLVIGATGGVGVTVLPLLARAGARVFATATDTDRDLIAGLGATPIAYGDYPDGVDTVFNLVLPSDQLADAAARIRPGGRLYTITFPPPGPSFINRDDVRFELVLDVDGTLGGMAEVARLTTTIGAEYTLDDGVRALTSFADRHTTGKVVVKIPC
ncbi:NADP-dependent oxidoreductase [Actinoplanes sp. NPDC051411]|uniref:NADP-dependent oxidoreductase n=1 Tax=Actinoplanes sp. NPDC051411 TaxID=3155522 RepID=UPI00342C9BA1